MCHFTTVCTDVDVDFTDLLSSLSIISLAQNQFIPRFPRSNANHHFLALPPSTCCPSSFQELYYRSFYSSSSSGAATTTVPSLLPPDIIPTILSYCDATTLSRASCVCHSWCIMANANELWTELCKEVFGVTPHELTPSPDPTRILYVLSHRKLREVLSLCRRGGGLFTNGMASSVIVREYWDLIRYRVTKRRSLMKRGRRSEYNKEQINIHENQHIVLSIIVHHEWMFVLFIIMKMSEPFELLVGTDSS